MKLVPLSTLATIQMGVHKPDVFGGDMLYLQGRDINESGRLVNDQERLMTSVEAVEERGLVQTNDVLLVGKGLRNTAVLYRADYPKAVASTLFYILRLHGDEVLPAYLAYYLNTPAAQAQLKLRVSSMTTVPVLNKKDFLDLPVPIPDQATQDKLVHLYEAYTQVRDLSLELLKKQESLIYHAFPRI